MEKKEEAGEMQEEKDEEIKKNINFFIWKMYDTLN